MRRLKINGSDHVKLASDIVFEPLSGAEEQSEDECQAEAAATGMVKNGKSA